MRGALAVMAAALVAALGAVILGEYPFDQWIVVGAGALLGLFVAEVFVSLSRRPGPVPALTCGALAAVGLVWAGWISTGHDLGALATEGWVAVAAGGAAAAVRAGWRGAGDTRPAPSRTQ